MKILQRESAEHYIAKAFLCTWGHLISPGFFVDSRQHSINQLIRKSEIQYYFGMFEAAKAKAAREAKHQLPPS